MSRLALDACVASVHRGGIMTASRKALIVVAALFAIAIALSFGGAVPTASAQTISVTSANPPTGEQGTLNLDVVVGGKGFKNGAKAKFYKAGTVGYQSDGEALAPAPNSLEPPVVVDLTTIVRNWASGAWRNYGLRLAIVPYADPGGQSYGITNFYSATKYQRPEQRPQLIVEYQ
jgi:hypothetical protein